MRRKTVLFLCLLTSMAGILSGCGGNKTGETNVTLETLAEDSSGSPTITSDAGTIQFKGTTSKDEVYDFGYKILKPFITKKGRCWMQIQKRYWCRGRLTKVISMDMKNRLCGYVQNAVI